MTGGKCLQRPKDGVRMICDPPWAGSEKCEHTSMGVRTTSICGARVFQERWMDGVGYGGHHSFFTVIAFERLLSLLQERRWSIGTVVFTFTSCGYDEH